MNNVTKPQAPKLSYTVLIQKKNQDHLVAIETENYDQAFELWQSLTDQWKTCIKEQSPFTLTAPVVTAFDPGLVLEINIIPVPIQTKETNNNPYRRDMLDRGLTETLNNYTRGTEMLDAGLKR